MQSGGKITKFIFNSCGAGNNVCQSEQAIKDLSFYSCWYCFGLKTFFSDEDDQNALQIALKRVTFLESLEHLCDNDLENIIDTWNRKRRKITVLTYYTCTVSIILST